jgi:predicted amidohydrolase
MIIDPWGRMIARIEGDEPGVLVADLDLELVTEARRRVPALDNARPFSISVNQPGPEQAAHRDRRQ